MNEGEISKVGGSRKKLIAGIVVAVIVVAGFTMWTLTDRTSDGPGALELPGIFVNVTKNESVYTIKVTEISIKGSHNLTKSWLQIDNLRFLLMDGDSKLGHILIIYSNKTHASNIRSGNVADVLSGSDEVIFYDNDYDGILSVNDTFMIKGNVLPYSEEDPQGVFSIIYEGHEGDLDGILNDDFITSIGEILLKNNEWWDWWVW